MLPVIALIGQKNVGKSTLFNRLTCKHNALIADYSGLTRDKQYGYLQYSSSSKFESIIIDTGGIDGFCGLAIEMQNKVHSQTISAIKESDIVLLMVDGRLEESAIDYDIVSFLRKLEKSTFIVVNKIDDASYHINKKIWNYYSLGIDNVFPISAIHGHGIDNLLETIFHKILKNEIKQNNYISTICMSRNVNCLQYCIQKPYFDLKNTITLAVVGRPNSGKSTFINHILGTNRMIVSSTPGTTRDSIYTYMIYNKQRYILIDTAGVRSKNKIVDDIAEQISIVRTFKIIKNTHVIVFMIDVSVGISDQDLSLLNFIINNGKALVVVMNKWDILSLAERKEIKISLRSRIRFIDFIQIHFISALYGSGIKNVFKSVQEAYCSSIQTINTARLTRVMHQAIIKCPPPLLHGKRKIKPKYVHFGGHSPPILVIHGAQVSKLSACYQRYLMKYFHFELKITGVLLRLQFKDTVNPFFEK